MKGLTACAIFFLFIPVPSLCQNTDSIAIRKYYQENSILWLGSGKYYKNEVAYPLRRLKTEMSGSPDALFEFKKYRKQETFAKIGFAAGTGLIVASFFERRRHYSTSSYIYAGVAVVAVSIPLHLGANKHLGRAVWYYNRDILLR